MSIEVPISLALHRSAVYRLLAMSFGYPTPLRLESVVTAATQAAATATGEIVSVLQRLADAARDADTAMLAGEHVALFQRGLRCPPYEGAYGPPQMAGKAAILADLAGFYRAFGMEPAPARPEIEDQVSVELEFMSALALREAWAVAERHAEGLEVTRDAQRAFLKDHLARWTTAFARGVAAAAAPGFYPAAAAAIEAWIEADCTRLGISPEPLNGVSRAEEAAFTCPMASTP